MLYNNFKRDTLLWYEKTFQFVNQKDVDLILEIGSDNYEGSTPYIAEKAKEWDKLFISIDISYKAIERLEEELAHTGMRWVAGVKGSKWCRGTTPALKNPIGLVFLDNFDYDWDVKQRSVEYERLKREYYALGLTLNNENSQQEHYRQVMYMYPYLSDNAVIAFNDTYLYNDCWIGKGGIAVAWLLTEDFEVVHYDKFQTFVILKRK